MSEWLDLDSIPKDGTVVLVWVAASKYQVSEDGENFMEHDVSDVDFGCWQNDGGGYVDNFMGTIGDQSCPVKWMHKPKAPV